MFLSFSVISCVFIASAVLADRRREHFRSRFLDSVDHVTSQNTSYSTNWAGAIWSQNAGTFNRVTGSFMVPVLSGQTNSAAVIWVGIDANASQEATLQAGITVTPDGHMGGTYVAWYEWSPEVVSVNFSNITISAGDHITLTVQAFSSTSGMAKIKNSSNGQSARVELSSGFALSGEDAEWIVEDPLDESEQPYPFANFGTVAFHHCRAGDQIHQEKYSPAGATLYNIQQNGHTLTSVNADGDSVIIDYVTTG